MIELPRAALTAGQIAEAAEFFSFGTNDLTQMTWGFSRDDVEAAFFTAYLEKGIFGVSPFETIDRDGVGRLVDDRRRGGPRGPPDLKLGVCGEHGGDPDSVHFFHEVGLDYVSCSPFRVPVAALEAGRVHLLVGFGAATFAPLIADISHWFEKRRGFAVAIAASRQLHRRRHLAADRRADDPRPWLARDLHRRRRPLPVTMIPLALTLRAPRARPRGGRAPPRWRIARRPRSACRPTPCRRC